MERQNHRPELNEGRSTSKQQSPVSFAELRTLTPPEARSSSCASHSPNTQQQHTSKFLGSAATQVTYSAPSRMLVNAAATTNGPQPDTEYLTNRGAEFDTARSAGLQPPPPLPEQGTVLVTNRQGNLAAFRAWIMAFAHQTLTALRRLKTFAKQKVLVLWVSVLNLCATLGQNITANWVVSACIFALFVAIAASLYHFVWQPVALPPVQVPEFPYKGQQDLKEIRQGYMDRNTQFGWGEGRGL